ncbi:MAG TPA: DUF4832 domain-containing protein [Clostridiales bacterium]|nr:DUF4832 domain-containing protein [Clostridiales bacterium]
MKIKSQRVFTVLVCIAMLLTAVVPGLIAEDVSVAGNGGHRNNDAYLPFGWVYHDRSDSFINEKLGLLSDYGIKTVYFSLGTITLEDDGGIQLVNNIATNKDGGLWENLGQWIKNASAQEISVIPIIDCPFNSCFNEDKGDGTLYGADVQAAITEIAESVFAEGFIYDGTAYYPVGIHFDGEPFRQVYHNLYLEIISSLRGTIGNDKTLSAATPAKNTSWSNAYLAQVASYLDRINPMLYDSNGLSSWGGVAGGVTQTADEYITLVRDTCLWYSEVFAQNNIDCVISPTVPCYPDSSYYDGNESFPENADGYVYIHLTDIENTVNCIKGIEEANALGANINSAGIWNFYYFCGDAEEFSPDDNPAYDYKAAQSAFKAWADGLPIQDISYSDSLADLRNPDRGFYRPVYLPLSLTETVSPWIAADTHLVHLLVGLAALSPVNNGGAEPLLNENMLANLTAVLNTLRESDRSVVIRFAYDDFAGTQDMEPSIETITAHIGQLADIFTEYSDIISSIEAGMIGPWGEMHSSAMAVQSNFSAITDALLDAAPADIGITVRRPLYYAGWRGISLDDLANDNPVSSETAYRVGIYNDGYLASESDYGTYENRANETSWLSRRATHTLFGGEAILLGDDRTYNCIEFASEEMFVTHTSYLNVEWNNTLIDYWRNEYYKGSDTLYYGQTAFKYISDHLGYRFTLKNSALGSANAGGNADIVFSIQNSGFGNIVKEKVTSLIFECGGETYVHETDIDIRELLSQDTMSKGISVNIPSDFPQGECRVYLRISANGDKTGAITFANEDIFNTELAANYIGTMTITAAPEETTTVPATETTTTPQETTTEQQETTTVPSTTQAPTEEETCGHICHASGFLGFIWRIINFFNKLFGINQYCSCGAAHW